MSKHQHLSVEDCYARGSSPFRTVIMTAQEARFINEQANLGFIKLSEKPTTIAIQKFRNDRLVIQDEDEVADSFDEAPAFDPTADLTPAAAPIVPVAAVAPAPTPEETSSAPAGSADSDTPAT